MYERFAWQNAVDEQKRAVLSSLVAQRADEVAQSTEHRGADTGTTTCTASCDQWLVCLYSKVPTSEETREQLS